MPCSKEVTFTGAEPGRVFWGFEPTPPFGALDLVSMPFFTDSDFDTLLQSSNTQTEIAQWRTGTGYYFSYLDPMFLWYRWYFWIAVPDSYDHPIATTGLQYGYGNTGTATNDVLLYIGESGEQYLQNAGGLSNWPSGSGGFNPSTNGWFYTPKTITNVVYGITGVPYRFYVFGAHFNTGTNIMQPGGGPFINVSLSRSRASNVATLVCDGSVNFSAWTGYAWTVSGCADATFDLAQPGSLITLDVAWTTVSYPNTGPDVGSVADLGFTATGWYRENLPWVADIPISDDHPIPENSCTLFVTT